MSKIDELDSMMGEQGYLSRPLPLSGVLVPAYIDLVHWGDKDFLYHGDLPGDEFVSWVRKTGTAGEPPFKLEDYKNPTPNPNLHGLLDEFVKLADRRPEDILTFAQRWGVLGLCEHLVPEASCSHGCRDNWLEPISAWRNYARRVQAILLVASKLHEGRVGAETDWSVILGVAGEPPVGWWDKLQMGLPALRESLAYIPLLDTEQSLQVEFGTSKVSVMTEFSKVADQKFLLGMIVDSILYLSGARLVFTWASGEPEISISPGGSLFAALASQLTFAVARSEGIALCAACSSPYIPRRKPQVGRRHYCPNCGSTAAKRDHARRKKIERRSGEDV